MGKKKKKALLIYYWHYMRGHLQELKKAQDEETLRDGESGAADGGGASSAPGQDETGIDHASDQAVIFSLAARNSRGAGNRGASCGTLRVLRRRR